MVFGRLLGIVGEWGGYESYELTTSQPRAAMPGLLYVSGLFQAAV